MIISYPALFYYSPEEEGYYICIPDIHGCGTQGDSINDALFMASDYLGMMASDVIEDGETLPKPSAINEVSLVDDFPFKDDEEFNDYYDFSKSFVSLVYVDLLDYLGDRELVEKTVSIPKWSNDLAVKLNLNLSEVLTEAIANEATK